MVSFGFATVPIFVKLPVLVVVVAFTVIVGSVTLVGIVAAVVQENELVAIFGTQVHGAIFGTETRVTPTGRVSVTVVVPVAVMSPSFRMKRV